VGIKSSKNRASGKLRIGDDWNAINIIALSQTNPLKAVAEFIENSIDANARNITIIRGREHGESYLRIIDDGDGIPQDEEGKPNFKYVATHICDSIKRQLKVNGARGIQGEFGIGLLSFWIVGEGVSLTSSGADGKTYQMHMKKGSPNYTITPTRALFPETGTTLLIKPLLAGVRQLNGEKIQWYLAAELRDRIRHSGVQINIVDRTARKQYKVEPRQFDGRLLHELPVVMAADGEIYLELYLTEPSADCAVSLSRMGTRVLTNLTELDEFQREPWSSGCLQGIVDVPFLNLTPGTRSGIIRDGRFERFCLALKNVETLLSQIIAEQRRAEDERASRKMLTTIRCEGEGIITVTDSLLPEMRQPAANRHGLPGYTFKKAAGELWRSKYEPELNVIVINNGHRDFVYASKNRSLKIRYICRLFAKEMVQKNFPGSSPDQLLERMIELSLYTEENLR
jgi:hypothetical protein